MRQVRSPKVRLGGGGEVRQTDKQEGTTPDSHRKLSLEMAYPACADCVTPQVTAVITPQDSSHSSVPILLDPNQLVALSVPDPRLGSPRHLDPSLSPFLAPQAEFHTATLGIALN